jgi:hypothetical protein
VVCSVGVCALAARSRVLPLEGENAEENDHEAESRCPGGAESAVRCLYGPHGFREVW